LMQYIDLLKQLYDGTELALWWGNPLVHPQLEDFLVALKARNLIANMTINSVHLFKDRDKVQYLIDNKLIYWLGVSYNPLFRNRLVWFDYDKMVVHCIAWVHTYDEIKHLLDKGKKILILWYKNFGRWTVEKKTESYNKKLEANLTDLRLKLPSLFWLWLISFDNLALKQLSVRNHFSDETWEKRFMWDDGVMTMYMDLVKWEYWLNSTAETRYEIGGKTMLDIWESIRR
jgi:hypothetical protein